MSFIVSRLSMKFDLFKRFHLYANLDIFLIKQHKKIKKYKQTNIIRINKEGGEIKNENK